MTLVAAFASISYGFYLIHPSVGYISAGGFLILFLMLLVAGQKAIDEQKPNYKKGVH